MKEVNMPPLTVWLLRDDLGNLVPSEMRVSVHAYARALIAKHKDQT